MPQKAVSSPECCEFDSDDLIPKLWQMKTQQTVTQNRPLQAGEMAPKLRRLAALVEDPGSNPSTHMALHNTKVNKIKLKASCVRHVLVLSDSCTGPVACL